VDRKLLRTNPVTVTETGHLTELLYDDGENDGSLVCAGHGGAVEPGTAEQAVELAVAAGVTCWATLGYDDAVGAFEAFHPPSSAVDTETYDLLAAIADRGFDTVLSLHGLEADEILVGGNLPAETKATVRDKLDSTLSIPVAIADADGEYAGTDADNFVNWLADGDGGLQLEQGETARTTESGLVVETLRELVETGVV
jgi:phage replication-related protein YjqB (UPF0714/DUF867 family)